MAIFNMVGGGGSGLNFSVVGGTVQPAGKENLVWVNTDTAISSWVVSPNEPASPAAGMVWIKDGSSNGINILDKNAVEVFPSSCQQYVDGMWKNVEAHLFRNGSWIQFSSAMLLLYQNGNQITENSGGWTKSGYSAGTTSLVDTGVIASDRLKIYGHTSGYTGVGTQNLINMQSFTRLRVQCTVISATNSLTAMVLSTKGNVTAAGGLRVASTVSDKTGSQIIDVDISNVSGGYVFFMAGGNTAHQTDIFEVWLE